ncbi:hypothetical protein SLEP1_g10926 [Rubroshorea leprosula]|uniref:Uncharacterized protein n=1 Tax=Rubroshorea leprosula TaxID=152421 RepID=A0AAV5IJN4_9ROSI|nr:hypothetical protein SLEP1_g10926 [Rubroshorea leprosula]
MLPVGYRSAACCCCYLLLPAAAACCCCCLLLPTIAAYCCLLRTKMMNADLLPAVAYWVPICCLLDTDLLPDLLPCGFFFAGKMMEIEEWRLKSGEPKKENRWMMTTGEWVF